MKKYVGLFILMICFPLYGQEPDFTVVVASDIHVGTGSSAQQNANWDTICDWVVANRSARNIVAVVVSGDLSSRSAYAADYPYTMCGSSGNCATLPVKGSNEIEGAGIPFLTEQGNHDYTGNTVPPIDRIKGSANFLSYYGASHYAAALYGGRYVTSFDPAIAQRNYAWTLTVGARKLMFLMMEFYPPSNAMDWATALVNGNPGYAVIMPTHAWLWGWNQNHPDQRVNSNLDTGIDGSHFWPGGGITSYMNPDDYNANYTPPTSGPNGMFTYAVQGWRPIRLIFGGHVLGGTNNWVSHITDTGTNGNQILQYRTNFQNYNSGNGAPFVQLLTFKPAASQLRISWYDCLNDVEFTGAPALAPIVETWYWQPVISNVTVVSGLTTASVTWTTDTASDSTVEYGATSAYGSSATGNAGATTHTVNLTGLTNGTTYHFRVKSLDSAKSQEYGTSDDAAFQTLGSTAVTASINSGGAATAVTMGGIGAAQAGDAAAQLMSGTAPYGTAVFSFAQNGTVVSEAGVPASPPTTLARIFVDYRTGVTIPGSSGAVDIYTGFAAVNRGAASAVITFTLRDLNGQDVTSGNGSLAKDGHIAAYIGQLHNLVPGFSVPLSFPLLTRFGTLEVSSSQPLSIVALRLTTNQRGVTLLTTTPIADLTLQPSNSPIYVPQLVDGGGYTTSLILLNPSGNVETGTMNLFTDGGSPLNVRQVNGSSGSSFQYKINPQGAYVFQTDASPPNTSAGWLELIPDSGTITPVGAGIYQYSPNGVLVTESGIPSANPTTHARVFVDTSGGHDTGLALGNPGSAPLNIGLASFAMDGSTQTGTSLGPLTLQSKGHAAAFIYQRISGLPPGFQGVVDITGNSPFVALTLRSLMNSRGDFLLTTFPLADLNRAAPTPLIFPQLADGGGYTTEFILLSAGSGGTVTISFFDDTGNPLAIGR